MNKVNFDKALGAKILESFKEGKNDILRGLEQLEKNYRNKEFLDLKARENILEAGYVLETAVYRSILYAADSKETMQTELQKLNSITNKLAMETNHEFLKAFNLKVCALISLFIIHEM